MAVVKKVMVDKETGQSLTYWDELVVWNEAVLRKFKERLRAKKERSNGR